MQKITTVQSNYDWQDTFFGYGLNFGTVDEKPDEFYRKIGVLIEEKCPVCGKVFYRHGKEYAYKMKVNGAMLFMCSHKCMREKECCVAKEHEAKIAARTKRRAEIAAAKKAQKAKQGG